MQVKSLSFLIIGKISTSLVTKSLLKSILRYRNDRSLQPRKPILYYLSSKIQANTRYNRRILLAFIRWVSRVNVVNERAQKRRKLNYIRFRSKLDLTKQISITHWSRLCASFIIIESLNY